MSSLRKLEPSEFPSRLLEIPQPPKNLYLEGELPQGIYLAIVGSRKYTGYGQEACEKIVRELAGRPIVIVSGLALGIDAIAHRAALAAGLATVAVPGSGLDRSVLYPSVNRRLADDIIAAGGALLSEFEPSMRPAAWTFPARNRIMAGLSVAVLVIEAEQKSGTMITARMAADYNRDVLAVPGSIFSSQSAGPHLLIKLGATPVTSGADVLDALNFHQSNQQPELFDELSPQEESILKLLRQKPLPREIILKESGFSSAETADALNILEVKGLIQERLGELSTL
ncbi:MAG TPA: DNA-processing protein DprA [Candidatus Paceibacterota bacterium]|nr:DNA-processing protein DprA [Candidatus Paceibacterota bacterium]